MGVQHVLNRVLLRGRIPMARLRRAVFRAVM
jgi:hypothetical protein